MKKLVSVLLCMAMIVCLLAGCASGEKETAQTASTGEGYKVALITMDSIDQHWITLKEGAEKAAKELGVALTFMATRAISLSSIPAALFPVRVCRRAKPRMDVLGQSR